MASQLIDGIGMIQLRDASSQTVFAGGYSSVTIAGNSSQAKAKRITTAGKTIISDARITLTEYELTLAQETHDVLSLGLASGELPKINANNDFFVLEDYTVPAVSVYEVTVTGLVAGNLTSCYVTIFENGVWNTTGGVIGAQRLTPISSGLPQPGEVLVAVGKLTFNAAQASAPIVVSYRKTGTSNLTIGQAAVVQSLVSFSFSATLYSDAFPNGLAVVCPTVSLTSPFNYKSDDVAVIENKFTIGVAAGKRTPYQLILL
jgi:hypothetical protein